MKTRPTSARGSTLFVVLFFMALLSVFVGAAFSLTSNTATATNRSTQMTLAYAVADSAMELVFSRWRSIVSFNTNKNLNAAVFITGDSPLNSETKDITVVTLSDLGLPAGYLGLSSSTNAAVGKISLKTVDSTGKVYGNYTNDRCTDSPTTLVEATRRGESGIYPPVPSSGADYSFRVASPNANGFQSIEMVYRVDVEVTVQTRTAPLTAKVRRHFTRSVASAAQAAYFYEDRLEIIPGTNTTIKGRVHTNKDLWIGDRTDVTLRFLNSVTYGDALVPRQNPVGAGAATFPPGLDGFDLLFARGYSPTPVPKMNVGGINRESLRPYVPASGRDVPNLSYNNNSLREQIETATTKDTLSVSDVFADASSRQYDDYWGTSTNTDGDQRAIEEARQYNKAAVKIILAYDSTGNLDLNKTIVRGPTAAGKADGVNADATASSSSVAYALSVVKSALTGTGTYPSGGTTFGPILMASQRVAVKDLRDGIGGDTVMATRINMAELRKAIEAVFFAEQTDGVYPPWGGTTKSLVKREGDFVYSGEVYIADATYGPAGGTLPASYNPFLYGTGPDSASVPTVEYNAAGGRVKHALILENATRLPGCTATNELDRSFTLATHNGVYIKGDYNTGGDTSTYQPASNFTADASASTVANYGGTAAWNVTAAIMADAVAVVSRNFDPLVADQPINAIKSTAGTPDLDADGNNIFLRGAVSTTVNSAIVTGQYQSSDNGYSGGSTNIIRFLENWTKPIEGSGSVVTGYNGASTQLYFTYKGSIMQSYTSKELSNKFLTPSRFQIYSPPVRKVLFDETFLVNPPVGFPGTITYTKGPWERPMS
ncbi:MAG: hypothetical protein JSR82_05500 [Verrucomicrobia bacterium]|nr:hypothetical protein [Verrucomicrobiota bacterium]